MDRQAKLSRLRFLLSELVEQLAEPQFDERQQFNLFTWSDIVKATEEIERLRSAVDMGPVLSIEGEGHTCGRVKSWRPSGRSAAEFMIIHPSGGGPLCEALWNTVRRTEIIENLKRWLRHVEYLLSTDSPTPRQTIPELASILGAMSSTHARLLQIIWDCGEIRWKDLAVCGWPDEDGGVLPSSARREVNRLVTWLSDNEKPELIKLSPGTAKADKAKLGQAGQK